MSTGDETWHATLTEQGLDVAEGRTEIWGVPVNIAASSRCMSASKDFITGELAEHALAAPGATL